MVLLAVVLVLVGHGKVLLQQNLLAVAGSVVVMAGATHQGTAAGAGSIAGAVAVCAVRNHLRCASGVCLILQCKITKVVERPGVHYRGRHSPGIFRSFCLQVRFFFRFFLGTASRFASARSTDSPKKNSSFSFFTNLHWISFPERSFSRSHAHFDCSFLHDFSQRTACLRLVLSENALFLPCCKE